MTWNHPEDIKPGQYVAVTHETKEQEDRGGGFFSFTPSSLITGIPMKVLAVDFPFVCVFVNNQKTAFDMRTVRLKIMSRAYAKACTAESQPNPTAIVVGPHGNCPLCKTDLVKQSLDKTERYACSQCDFIYVRPTPQEKT